MDRAMTNTEIGILQKRVGTIPDEFWGPKSIRSTKDHLLALMPKPNPWPKPDDASMIAFYGQPGDEDNLQTFTLPYPLYYDGTPVHRIRCHRKVGASLLRVLEDIKARHGSDRNIMRWIAAYAGCFNDRSMRGGSRKSKHAWGVAVDFSPDSNGMHTAWPVGATMPIEIIEAFSREGWTSAAAWWSRDAMHFEATDPT